jgi:tetratricopeptide (TPR) repeat protein
MGAFGIPAGDSGRTGSHRLRAFRRCLAAFALCAPFAAAMAGDVAPAPVSATARPNLEILLNVAKASDARDCTTVLKLGLPLADSREPLALPDEAEALLYEMVARCEVDSDRDRAYALALRASALEHSSDGIWRFRLALELDAKRNEAALATVEAMARGRGAALNSVPVQWMGQFHRTLRDAKQNALRFRLLKVLASDSYAPEEVSGLTDDFRVPYAVMLVGKGDSAGARAMLASLRSPDSLAEASLDSRLRGLVPADLDLRRKAEAVLAIHREAIARHPDELSPVIDAARDLRQLGRPQEAVDLLRTAAAGLDKPEFFTDRDDKLNWYWDSLASSETALGRYDDTLAAYRKGVATQERSSANVSQVINLADAQIGFRRGEEALQTLAAFDDPSRRGSPYGEMELHLARGCAHAIAGHPAAAVADLAFAKAHEKDDPRALTDLFLCLGDMDGAAAVMIRRLDDPDRRSAALLQLSDYDDPPVPLPPHPVNSHLPALKQRPDVKAAITRAGGIRRFQLQAGEL